MKITGKDIIALGYEPGDWLGKACAYANMFASEDLRTVVERFRNRTVMPLQAGAPYVMNIAPASPEEHINVDSVRAHMEALVKVPTVVSAAVMPDACPINEAPGTIPVGGVAATKNAIHPGMHSADICCSMFMTNLGRIDPADVLNAGHKLTHFGPGGRPRGAQFQPASDVLESFTANQFLAGLESSAIEHFATQGDGNHFFYVGTLKSTGDTCIVTHHGSRKPGAMLYKRGKAIAEQMTAAISPETPKHNAWIAADAPHGEAYWEALQIIRAWTKASHCKIHDLICEALGAKPIDRFWNEHNFVFRKPDGLFYHAKGATPAFAGWASDATDLTLIPLNMSKPILIARGLNNGDALGFAPHGAGRNMGRKAFMRMNDGKTPDEMITEQTAGLDIRFYCGKPDISELPGAYKDADTIRQQIEEFSLAEIVDEILPYGCIMAGEGEQFWRRK